MVRAKGEEFDSLLRVPTSPILWFKWVKYGLIRCIQLVLGLPYNLTLPHGCTLKILVSSLYSFAPPPTHHHLFKYGVKIYPLLHLSMQSSI